MNLVDLETFVKVAEHGTLTGAADELGVPKSTVSRRVSRLEDELGVALVRRKARSIAITDRGRHLQQRTAAALREIGEAERSLHELDDTPRGLLRITAPSDMGTTKVFTEFFAAFRRRWPEVFLELDLTDRVVDLIGEGYDVALRPTGPRNDAGAAPTEGLMSRSLGHLQAGLFAAPDYLERAGTPAQPEDLATHEWVTHRVWGRHGTLQLTCPASGEVREVPLNTVIGTNHVGHVLQLVAEGAGVGAAPYFLARPWEADGSVVELFPGWQLPGGRLNAIWPATRHLSPRLRAFLDFAVEHLDLPGMEARG